MESTENNDQIHCKEENDDEMSHTPLAIWSESGGEDQLNGPQQDLKATRRNFKKIPVHKELRLWWEVIVDDIV